LDGYTYCGARTLLVTDTITGLPVTNYSYNSATGILNLTPTF